MTLVNDMVEISKINKCYWSLDHRELHRTQSVKQIEKSGAGKDKGRLGNVTERGALLCP